MSLFKHAKILTVGSSNGHAKSFLSIVSAAVNLLAYFFVMRLVYKSYGLDAVGLWSLVMALSSIVRLLDFSGAITLNRMLPVEAHSDNDRADFIDTMSIFVVVFYFLGSILVFSLCVGYLTPFNAQESVTRPDLIFIVCLFAVSCHVLSALNLVALDGLGYSQWRSFIVLIASLIFLGSSVFLVPWLGLLGLAGAQLCQHIFATLAGRNMLRRLNPKLMWLPRNFKAFVLVKCLRFGFFFELTSRPKMLLDPVVRIIVGTTVSLEALGIYDLAGKIVVQTNGLVQAMLSPRVPEFAHSSSQSSLSLRDAFNKTVCVYTPLVMCIYASVLVGAFGVSFIVFAEIKPIYIFVSSVLILGHGLASLGLISQMYAQAVADFKWSVIGQVSTVFVTAIALSFIVTEISVPKIAVIVSSSIFFGALVEYLGLHSRHHIPTLWHHNVDTYPIVSIIIFITSVSFSIAYALGSVG